MRCDHAFACGTCNATVTELRAEIERLKGGILGREDWARELLDIIHPLRAAAQTVVDEARDRREGGWTSASWDAMNALDAALRPTAATPKEG